MTIVLAALLWRSHAGKAVPTALELCHGMSVLRGWHGEDLLFWLVRINDVGRELGNHANIVCLGSVSSALL
jgi:hypothetical protein